MSSSKVLATLRAQQGSLIESIYQTAIDTSHWQHFMHQVVEAIDGRSSRILFMNRSADKVYASSMVNTDDSYHQQYVDYYVNACPWRSEIASKPKGRMYSSYLDFSCKQKEFHNGHFYHDWAKPQDIEHGMGGTVNCSDDTCIQLLIQRSREPGPFTRDETSFIDTLIPHIRRSLNLNQQLEANRLLTQAVTQVSQISPLPFVLLDERLQICHMSTQAEGILSNHPLIGIKRQRLACREAAAQQRLQRMLKLTGPNRGNDPGNPGGNLTLSPGSEDQLELLCCPLHENYSSSTSARKAFVAVFLNLNHWFRFDRPRLKNNYALTETEILLAESLFNGMTLQDCADQRGTSIHTVRTQCKHLLAKLSVPRQVALNRVLIPYIAR